MIASERELSGIYREYFSLGNVACDIGSKFALISLVCFLTKQARSKNPDATTYQVIKKVRGTSCNSETLLLGLATICNDFMKNTTEFLTFDMKTSKDMVNKINEILNKELPFTTDGDDLPF